MPNDLTPTEAVFSDLIKGDMTIEQEMRNAGRTVDADAHKATRDARLAGMRADLGLPASVVIDPREAKAADERCQSLTAAPSDYHLNISTLKMSEAGASELNEGLRSMAVANRLEKNFANGLLDACVEACAAIKPNDREAQINQRDANIRLINQRAGSPEKGAARIETARQFLMRGGKLNSVIAEHLAHDPLVAELAVQLANAAKSK